MTTKKHVDVKRFLRAYVSATKNGGNQSDVARELGCTAANVCTRLKRLKEAGVKLPKLNPGLKGRYNVKELNKYVSEIN